MPRSMNSKLSHGHLWKRQAPHPNAVSSSSTINTITTGYLNSNPTTAPQSHLIREAHYDVLDTKQRNSISLVMTSLPPAPGRGIYIFSDGRVVPSQLYMSSLLAALHGSLDGVDLESVRLLDALASPLLISRRLNAYCDHD